MMIFEPRRLHPVAALLNFLKYSKDLFFPVLFFFFIGSGEESDLFDFYYFIGIGITIFFLLISGILHWFKYSYWVENNELRIEYGIFIRKKRYIPIHRIQAIHISSGLLQRAFGLVKLQVETAGGGKEAEGILNAVRVHEAEELQAILSHEKEDAAIQISEAGNHLYQYHLTKKELILAASTSGGIGIVLSGLAALFGQFIELIPYESVYERAIRFIDLSVITYLLLLIFVLFIIAWIGGILFTALKYANFHVVKKGNELQIVKGLIEKRQITLPIQKIQAIRIQANVIRQPLGFVTVYVESAGASDDKGEDFSTVLFPFVRKNRVAQLLEQFVPNYILKETFHPAPRRAKKRYLTRAVLPVIPVCILLSYFLKPWGNLSISLIPIAVILGYFRYKAAGWYLQDNQLIMKYRFFSLAIIILQRKRIQVIEKRQSFFQRKQKLGSIQASIRARIAGKNFKVVDLDIEHCEQLYSWYSHQRKKE